VFGFFALILNDYIGKHIFIKYENNKNETKKFFYFANFDVSLINCKNGYNMKDNFFSLEEIIFNWNTCK